MKMQIGVGDITKVQNVDAIVNAANGIGVMGAGLAGALADSGGDLLRNAARAYFNEHGATEAGKCYKTDAGLLKRRGVKEIYHAVTMKYPGQFSSINIISMALRSVFAEAMISGIDSIAIPGLGTGIGGLDKVQVAQRMASIIESNQGQFRIVVVDRSKEFIDAFCKSISSEYEPWENT